ncbi:MAG: D-glycero-beta-D-manno-heptose 1-phosphate adenylyltransferase [Pseudomonadota bacterium]|nr:D-glycero-beta-D-manno-heptose 1-phosphate adenylyltransferase [Alphaproteobacteria bacterium]MEC7703131.1 D-glycero-beta-D-manno-heptose 1-phosphate adenylyltransferase [Pseudomonadota bacterium]MEC9236850.1 D-glycero-beta-D-manno-heptose 1-phosphate adenylyltransferase [Pseudomonadota bacterium]|tara:strand:- start:125 stop:652 length:528 start_codon:yes stop_codon:yes gene_type:complete
MLSKDRVKAPKDLAEIIDTEKAAGQKVVFTNGIFDFVHAGHLEYLEKARSLGDMLVIAINSDTSTSRIKGPSRPINKQADRAQILAGLRCVDYVTIFDQDTPTEILDILKPSIHAKGGDYDPEKMPETPTVRKNGGEVVIIPLKDGYSNSKQFEKIQDTKDDKFERPDWLAGAQK